MSVYKDVITESNHLISIAIDKAPVQVISVSEITPVVNRMKAMVPDSDKMSIGQLTVIAHESILYRLVPGRDIHYFLNPRDGKLNRVFDYKFLKNFCTFKEQQLSGDDSAVIDDTYRVLTEPEMAKHNLGEGMIAAECRIVTARERKAFGGEVKRWLDMGFNTDQAVAMAEKVYGEIGTTAIGAVKKSDYTPKGWSSLQWAEKLAFKNCVNRKYGIPTADEMQGMAYRMASRAMPEHWKDEYADQPIDIQARLADLEAIAAEVQIEAVDFTPEDHAERLEENVDVLRGPVEDEGIGEDYEQPHLIDLSPEMEAEINRSASNYAE